MKYRRFTLNEIQVDLLNRILAMPENSVSHLAGTLGLNGYEIRFLGEMRDYFSGSKDREYGKRAWFDGDVDNVK